MSKKVSMDDIAKKLGVSKNTVSLALRNMPLISAKTKGLVQSTAKEMGYVYEARNNPPCLSKDQNKNICMLVPRNIRNIEFFSLIQFGIEKEARKHNLNIILYYVDENGFDAPPACITEQTADGIIMLGCLPKTLVSQICSFGLPIVSVDNYYDNILIDYILTDNITSSFNMTDHLIKNGHKRIGFFGNIGLSSSFFDRYLGYYKAIQANNLSFGEEWIIKNNLSDYNGILEHLKAGRSGLPSAFFCVNDVHAIKLIKALENLSVTVPNEVSVSGFDDIPQSEECVPKLTTIHVYKELTGETAVLRLVSIMEKMKQVPEKILISTKLVERDSVRRLSS